MRVRIVVRTEGLRLAFQKNGPTYSKLASWLHSRFPFILFLERWGFMDTNDLYCPEGNHWEINLIKQRQRNKYRLGSDKTTVVFWQWSLPFETNTDVFGWFLMLLKNSTSFSHSPKGDKTTGDGRSTRFRVPITLSSLIFLVTPTNGSWLQSNVTSRKLLQVGWAYRLLPLTS